MCAMENRGGRRQSLWRRGVSERREPPWLGPLPMGPLRFDARLRRARDAVLVQERSVPLADSTTIETSNAPSRAA